RLRTMRRAHRRCLPSTGYASDPPARPPRLHAPVDLPHTTINARSAMNVSVRFLVSEEPPLCVDVPAGGFIGRSPFATLHLDDPRVSEAHALVSLRHGSLYLLALRRRFAVDGRPADELRLAEGQLIELAPEL